LCCRRRRSDGRQSGRSRLRSYIGDFPPIADIIDPDSLEELFKFDRSTDDRNWRCLRFEFVTRRVSLYSDGSLILEPIDATDPRR